MLTSAQRAAVLFLSAPEGERGTTRDAFCATIGVNVRTFDRWKVENTEFMRAVDKSRKAYATSPDYYALCMRRKALALIDEGLSMPIGDKPGQLSSSERRQYISAVLAETKAVSDTLDTIDRSHLTDQELLAEVLARGVGENVTQFIEAVDLLKGERSSCSNSSPEPSSPSLAPPSDSKLVVALPTKPRAKRKPSAKKSKGRGGLRVPPKAIT